MLVRNLHKKLFRAALASNKHVLNTSSCGLGKTTQIANYIEDTVYPPELRDMGADIKETIALDNRFIICIPTHNQAEGEMNIEGMLRERNINAVHFYGKGQRIRDFSWNKKDVCYCMQSPEKREFPGCSFHIDHVDSSKFPSYEIFGDWAQCPFRNCCEYKKQFKRCADATVIITAVESFARFTDMKNSIGDDIKKITVIFDEGIDIKSLVNFETPNENYFHKFTDEEISMFGNLGEEIITDEMKVKTLKFYKFTPKSFLKLDLFRHKLSRFFESTTDHVVVKTKKHGNHLHGKRIFNFEHVDHIIYCDATADSDTVASLTNTKLSDWEIVHVESENRADIVGIRGNWFRDEVNEKLKDISDFITDSTSRGRVLVICKADVKKNIEQISPILKNIDFVTYGDARGSNRCDRDYKMIVQIGTYAFNPLTMVLFNMVCGFGKSTVQLISDAEIIQSWSRSRSFKRETKNVCFLKKSILNKIQPNRTDISFEAFVDSQTMSRRNMSDKEPVRRNQRMKDTIFFNNWKSYNTDRDKIKRIKELHDIGKKPVEIIQITGIPKPTVYKILGRLET